MDRCKLSIITINFNNAKGLERTIRSVAGQSFKDYEYIIIDGGSTDGSLNIIEQHKDSFSYRVSEKDQGVYHAMNKGIRQAAGEYCYFLNSGDHLAADTVLREMFDSSEGEDIVYGNMINGELNRVDRGINKIRFFDFFTGSIYHQSAFIRRKLFDEIGLYNESLKIVSDWEFFIKAIFLNKCSCKYVNINVAFYETGGLSFQNHEYNLSERKLVLEKYFPLFYEDYRELENYKFSDFAGIFRKMEKSPVLKPLLRSGLAVSRFVKFKVLRRNH